MILAIYVDDGLIFADSQECIDRLIEHLQAKFEIKAMNVGCFVGMQIQVKNDGSIFINQEAYTSKVLRKFRIENGQTVVVPSDPNQVLSNFEEANSSDFPYRQLIGSLMYLAVATRPDISFAVGNASRYMENPKQVHVDAAKRILKYLKGTIDLGIIYQGNGDQFLSGYSDADYAGDVVTRRSTSGFAFLFGGIISWSSERQKSVALSTMESEYISASNAVKELIWLKRLFNELLPDSCNEVKFLMDNQSAIRLVKNPEFHKRSKHIDVRYHFIREQYERKEFTLDYVLSNLMVADIHLFLKRC